MAEDMPSRIGRYVVQGILGRGAMGVVYRAHDPEIDRGLAIKLVAAALLDGDGGKEHLRRFQREARASGRCNHPNIVAVHDVGTHEGRPFLAMELVQGSTLAALLANGRRFQPVEAERVLAQLLSALGCVHAAGIVHRDVKPSNLLLHGELAMKLADFGIARVDGSELTLAGSMVGTPSYMAPEQCRGEAADARSDLFSAAAVLYEMLTGERAFGRDTMVAVMQRILEQQPAPLPATLRAAAPGLAALLDRALAKRPQDRFASAAEMATALHEACAGAAAWPMDDHTILDPTGIDPTGTATGSLGAEALASIERSLAAYVGPIARMLVRSAARSAVSPAHFYDKLAQSIASEDDRRRFLRDATAAGRTDSLSSGIRALPGGATDEAELQRITAALASHVGPLARVLVARAIAGSTSREALWQRLSLHIDDPVERAQFLRRRG
jgi:serine/threonine-protein kinase